MASLTKGWMDRLRRAFVGVSDETIIKAMDPWVLACAVGAENGTVGVPMGFSYWLGRSRENWMPKVKQITGASERRIVSALRGFVSGNINKDMRQVLTEQQAMRGIFPRPQGGCEDEE